MEYKCDVCEKKIDKKGRGKYYPLKSYSRDSNKCLYYHAMCIKCRICDNVMSTKKGIKTYDGNFWHPKCCKCICGCTNPNKFRLDYRYNEVRHKYCKYNHSKYILDSFIDLFGPEKCLVRACECGQVDMVKRLLKHERVYPGNSEWRTIANWDFDVKFYPIIEACSRGHYDIVKLLLKEGADPSVNESQALRDACRGQYYNIVKLLLKDGRVDPSDNPFGYHDSYEICDKNGYDDIYKLLSEWTNFKMLNTWSKEVHKFYPQKFQNEVYQWLLVCKRLKFNKDVKMMVVGELAKFL